LEAMECGNQTFLWKVVVAATPRSLHSRVILSDYFPLPGGQRAPWGANFTAPHRVGGRHEVPGGGVIIRSFPAKKTSPLMGEGRVGVVRCASPSPLSPPVEEGVIIRSFPAKKTSPSTGEGRVGVIYRFLSNASPSPLSPPVEGGVSLEAMKCGNQTFLWKVVVAATTRSLHSITSRSYW